MEIEKAVWSFPVSQDGVSFSDIVEESLVEAIGIWSLILDAL